MMLVRNPAMNKMNKMKHEHSLALSILIQKLLSYCALSTNPSTNAAMAVFQVDLNQCDGAAIRFVERGYMSPSTGFTVETRLLGGIIGMSEEKWKRKFQIVAGSDRPVFHLKGRRMGCRSVLARVIICYSVDGEWFERDVKRGLSVCLPDGS